MKGPKIGPLSFDWKDHGGWLYAFVVDGEVKYIGLTGRVLRGRMDDYSHIPNSTNHWIEGQDYRRIVGRSAGPGLRMETRRQGYSRKRGIAA
jgi:hypothetical protein